MTGEETEQRNIAAMGQDLGKQYSALCHELTALYLYWKEFIELFGTNDKRIERLNKSAPGFFQMLQEQQFETNMLHLARITDVSKTGTKENLTVCNLPDLVSDEALRASLLPLINDARAKTEFCRDWRNRRFAHHDLKIAMRDGSARPLELATKEKFFEALKALSDLLNVIERHYYKGFCQFDAVVGQKGAMTLLHVLGLGVMALDRRKEMIAKSDFSFEMPPQV